VAATPFGLEFAAAAARLIGVERRGGIRLRARRVRRCRRRGREAAGDFVGEEETRAEAERQTDDAQENVFAHKMVVKRCSLSEK
jgi:hypothetical protein